MRKDFCKRGVGVDIGFLWFAGNGGFFLKGIKKRLPGQPSFFMVGMIIC